MIVDSSAAVAIMVREPGSISVLEVLSGAPRAGIGSPTLVDTGIVLTARLGVRARSLLSRFVEEFELVIIPFGERHATVAMEAYQRFGRGRHPASLNFGDCMTYATARLADEPLLCLGNDFPQTDLQIAALDSNGFR